MSSNSPKKLLLLAAAGGLVWLFLRYLLPIALPFLLAALLALAAEPLVQLLHGRLKLSRPLATGIGVTVTLAITALTVTVLGALLVRQLQSLVGVMPDLEGSAQNALESLQSWLLDLAQRTPTGIRPMVEHTVADLFNDGNAFLDQLTGKLLELASGFVTRLPDSALGIGTWLLASFMISAKLPSIRAYLSRKTPRDWNEKYLPSLQRMKKSVLGWLTAQLKLMGITFVVLMLGFWLLKVSHGPIWAILIALVDALPVLGTGTVLVPWSIVCFLQHNTMQALGLLGLYAVVMLLRSALEPKLVGKQLGLDPLVTLGAMYAGYRLWGIPGMLFAPLLAVIAVQWFTQSKEI